MARPRIQATAPQAPRRLKAAATYAEFRVWIEDALGRIVEALDKTEEDVLNKKIADEISHIKAEIAEIAAARKEGMGP